MADKVGGMFVSLAASAAKFSSDMEKARGAAKTSAGGISTSFGNASKKTSSFTKNISLMKGGAVGLAGAAGLGYLIKQSIATADRIAKVADSANVGTGFLQEMQYAAALAGIDQETLNKALQGFSKRIGEAKSGTGSLITLLNKMDKAFLEDVKAATSTEEAFDLIIKKGASMDDAMQRSALYAAAFGRSAGIEMTLLVKDGAAGLDEMRQAARDLGLVISEDLLRGAETASDQMETMHRVISTQLTTSFLNLAPTVTKTTKAITDALPSLFDYVNKILEFTGMKEKDPLAEFEGALADVNTVLAYEMEQIQNIGWAIGTTFGDTAIDEHRKKIAFLTVQQQIYEAAIKKIKDAESAAHEKAMSDAAALAAAEALKLKNSQDQIKQTQDLAAAKAKAAEEEKKQAEESAKLEESKFQVIAAFSAMAHDMTTDQFELERQELLANVEAWRAAGVMETEITKAESAKRKKIAEDEFKFKLGEFNKIANAAANLADQALAYEKTQIASREAANVKFAETQYESDIASIKKSYTEGGKLTERGLELMASAESRFADTKSRLRDKAAAEEKAAARKYRLIKVAQAISNTAVAVTEALPNLVLAGLIGVAGAFQVGTIMGQPYKQGGVVNTATYFPDPSSASGVGKAGEEPGNVEGILPLARMPGGDLGVNAAGIGGGDITLKQYFSFEGITEENFIMKKAVPIIERAAKNGLTDIITSKNPKQSQLRTAQTGGGF